MEYLNGNLTREEVRKTDLYARGDCINIWVNQGEFEMLQMEHETMRQQLAQHPPQSESVKEALEKAANICDDLGKDYSKLANNDGLYQYIADGVGMCSGAIRALIEQADAQKET